jgi:hypothetical protein
MSLTISKPSDYTRAAITQSLGYVPTRELTAQQREAVSSAELRFESAQGDTNNIGLYNEACTMRQNLYNGMLDYINKAIKITTDEANANAGDAVGAKAKLEALNSEATAYLTGAKVVFGKNALATAENNTLTLSDGTELTITCSADIAAAPLAKAAATAVVNPDTTGAFLTGLQTLKATLTAELSLLDKEGFKNPVLKIKTDSAQRSLEDAATTIKETLEANNIEIAKFLDEADAKDDRSLLSALYRVDRLRQIAQLVFRPK